MAFYIFAYAYLFCIHSLVRCLCQLWPFLFRLSVSLLCYKNSLNILESSSLPDVSFANIFSSVASFLILLKFFLNSVFSFNEIKIINSFMGCLFSGIPKKKCHCHAQDHPDFLLSPSPTALYFTFRSRIHFELILEEVCFLTHFFAYRCPVVPASFKRLFAPQYWLC